MKLNAINKSQMARRFVKDKDNGTWPPTETRDKTLLELVQKPTIGLN